MLKLGNKSISNLFVGQKAAAKAYLGQKLVWQKATGLPYDAEVEYLESTGTQWIDTGYAVTTDIVKIASRYSFSSSSSSSTVWGSQTSADKNWLANQYGNSWWFGTTSGQFYGSQGTSIRDVEWNINNGSVNGIVGGTSYSGTYSGSVVSNSNVYLFAANQGGTAIRLSYCVIYGFKLQDNGVLVRDFIPVRVGGVGYMYDKVSGQLFGNQGTGSFVIGPDKYNYQGYINNGLIAMWDGIDNAGNGVHDASATTWKELVSGVEYEIGARTFTALGLSWSNTSTLSFAPDAIKGESFFTGDKTVEFCGDVACTTYNSVMLGGQSNLGFRQNAYGTAPNRYYNVNVSTYNVGAQGWMQIHEDNGTFANVKHRTALVINNSYVQPYYEGVAKLYNRSVTIPSYTTGFTSLIWPGVNGCVAHCIRIYNRALTAEEIAQNYDIDKRRFNLT